VQLAGAVDGRAYFGFGASGSGTLSVVLAGNTNQFILMKNINYGYSNLSAVSQTYQANHWYRVEVSWAVGGTIIARLYDSDGTTLINSVKGKTNSITQGGIAFRGFGSNKYWDTVTMRQGTQVDQGVGGGGSSGGAGSGLVFNLPAMPAAAATPHSVASPVAASPVTGTVAVFLPVNANQPAAAAAPIAAATVLPRADAPAPLGTPAVTASGRQESGGDALPPDAEEDRDAVPPTEDQEPMAEGPGRLIAVALSGSRSGARRAELVESGLVATPTHVRADSSGESALEACFADRGWVAELAAGRQDRFAIESEQVPATAAPALATVALALSLGLPCGLSDRQRPDRGRRRLPA
jgi:hypothetical protein